MRALVVAVVIVLALAGSGCVGDGGGGTEAAEAGPDEWSGQICAAVGNWAGDLRTRASRPPKTVRTVADVRAQLVEFIEDVVSRTDELLADVRAAGRPSVEDGDRIAADLLTRLQSLRATLARARATVERLPDDPSGFEPAAQNLASSIQRAGRDIGDQIDQLDEKYDAEELSKAFADNPRCKELSGSSSS